uniref:Synaptosomal-associated protein 91 n=1 Tax=Nothobranchius kuhntae TaxID=321403 RepID=A0A1A8JJ12_NOTKU
MFDSMPEQSPTTESKAATTPSVDLFGAVPTTTPAPAAAPEASSPPKAEPEIDLLDSFSGPVEATQSSAPGGPGGDLLGGLISPTLAPTAAPALAPTLAPALAPAPVQNNLLETGFDSLGSLSSPTPPVPAARTSAELVSSTPVPSGGFDASMLGGLGDLLMPAVTPQSTGGSTSGSTGGSMGTPIAAGGTSAIPPATPPPTKTIGGDLDSSLANLVGDLGMKKKDPLSEKRLTGGANWTPQVAPTSWGTPGAPMAATAPGAPGSAPPAAAMVPAQPGFGMSPAGGPGAPMIPPMMGQPLMSQSMIRPPFTGVTGAAPGAPISAGSAGQSPKKPKDPLADLNLKDFL